MSDALSATAARAPRRYAQHAATAATLVLGLAVTYAAYRFAQQVVQTQAESAFAARAADVRDAIQERMAAYAQVLRGGTGFYAGSERIERAEWRAYVRSLRIDTTYPGIQGLGVIERLPAAELAGHERAMRADGFERYTVFPRGDRAEYTPITYLEPMDADNVRSIGFDTSSEPVRREALARAVAVAEPVLSGKATLTNDSLEGAQPGLLMYAAVFRRGMPVDTLNEKQKAVRGFIYARFRAHDLMRQLLGAVPDVRVEVFDGASMSAASLLYDSSPALSGTHREPLFETAIRIFVQDRPWTLHVTSLPQFEKDIDRARPRYTLATGLVVTLMLTALAWLLSTSRDRAVRLAQRMTEELRESRERLSLAIEGSNLAMFDWDITVDSVQLSPRWNLMLGGAAEETVTSSAGLNALVHPDDVEQVRTGLGRTLSGRTPFYHVEHRVRMRDGGWKWILSRGKVTARDARGRALRFTGVNSDISERKAVEDLKNQFIGSVSHELRTPLTAVIGSLALLKEEYGDKAPPEAATFLDMAFQNSERLAALVDDILDLEKADAGKLDLKLEPVEVTPLLEEAAALNTPFAAKFGTRFEVAPATAALSVRADRRRLMQVLTNFLSNAAKHSPAGVPVTLRASAVDGRVRLEVVDRGPGIPVAFRERLFERFSQADPADERAKGGTGLGLPLAKAMTEAMGGELGFESTPGEGATFYVLLPLS